MHCVRQCFRGDICAHHSIQECEGEIGDACLHGERVSSVRSFGERDDEDFLEPEGSVVDISQAVMLWQAVKTIDTLWLWLFLLVGLELRSRRELVGGKGDDEV